ncbi:MAG TPA: hypothetical protein VL993_00110 [Stellaceae bacterium]|nr:hypothetical protein [Stellaceae bacterium]
MSGWKFAGHEGTAVTLAGRVWIMADLAPRQFRKVVPAMLALGGVKRAEDLDEARIERLIDALYWALTRNYPDLAREEFLDLPIRPGELFAAIPVLAKVAGFERREAAQPGEARGAAEASTISSIH